MRIDSIEIDGFGRFDREVFGPFSRGLTVIHGPNEAGKSTLHAFIRTMLFGFPRRGSSEWIPALSGARHGGRLVLRNRDGERIIVERHSDEQRGAARVMFADGEAGDDMTLNEMLGNVTSGIFQTIFAFGIDELQSIESLPADAISGRIYAAGLGAEKLPETAIRFQREASEIFLPRGRVQPVAQIFRELEEIDRELAQTRALLEGYYQLCDRRDRIADDLRSIEHSLDTIDACDHRLMTGHRAHIAALDAFDEARACFEQTASAVGRLQARTSENPLPAMDSHTLRLQIDELRETWARLQATRRMIEVYQQSVNRSSIPRAPVLLAILIFGAMLQVLVGAFIGQPVIIVAGIASAILGAITLILVALTHTRANTSQRRAWLQLERTHREEVGRFIRAAQVIGIDPDVVDLEIDRLERALAMIESAEASRPEIDRLQRLLADHRLQMERADNDLESATRELNEATSEWALFASQLDLQGESSAHPSKTRDAFERQRDELLVERGRLDERLQQLETDTLNAELMTRKEVLLTRLREHAREWAVNVVAGSLLREAQRIYEDERQPAVLREASDAFDAMTLGAYHRLVMAGNHEDIVAIGRDGKHVSVAEMSRGTREQAYLALRIGLIREFGTRIKALPVLIDDVFVNFDPDRAAEAMRALTGLAATHQVLVFTCHPSTVDLARAQNASTRVIQLDRQGVPGLTPIWIESS